MAKRRKRRSTLKIVAGEVRGVFSTTAALMGSWRDEAGRVIRPVRRLIKRRKRSGDEELLSLPAYEDPADYYIPDDGEQPLDSWAAELNDVRAEMVSAEDQYRRVIRSLIKQIVRNQTGSLEEREARKERNEALYTKMREAEAEVSALRRSLMALETKLAIAEARGEGTDETRRQARVLRRELDNARRRLARAERDREQSEAPSAPPQWEDLEDEDDAENAIERELKPLRGHHVPTH